MGKPRGSLTLKIETMNPYTLNYTLHEFLALNPLIYKEFKEDACRVYIAQGEAGRITLFQLSDWNVTEANTQFVLLNKKTK